MLEKWSSEWSEERIQVGVGKEEEDAAYSKGGLGLKWPKGIKKGPSDLSCKELAERKKRSIGRESGVCLL